MKIVAQRVSRSSVTVGGKIIGEIGPGMCILVGVAPEDTEREAVWIADKIADLRVFEDEAGKMNKSLSDAGGEALVISQFTLYADCSKGRRPSFTGAASSDAAKALYESFANRMGERGIVVRTGIFGADMKVEIVNEGPVTIILDTAIDMPHK
ncbi:MAG: D-tyrosyl-tRNA(Tyr) deacylase [Synergistaceae bacterium]|jgi:D-tyrosyl-tRNA(Tyr) deacylase|nr:D-tyrosyl-tRNA(Tyr) deacylase [Synergistaceae bacterium]